MTIFYIFATLLILQSLISLKQGFDYLAYFQNFKNPSDFAPKTAILAPCKGLDSEMDNYFKSLFEQDYSNYQIIFVVENDLDPVFKEINSWRSKYPNIKSACLIAGKTTSTSCGQKVHNLQVAISSLDKEVEAFAFVDSDVSLPRNWLKSLLSPLSDKTIGATTGYRWFIPTTKNFASLLRSAWNASIASSLGGHKNNFAWGGSMAILRETFEKINVNSHWAETVSDDYALTKAVKISKDKLYIKFVPLCLVPSLGGCTLSELLEFTTRQIIITKVYSPNLWKLLLFSNLMFNSVFFIGLILGFYKLLVANNFLPLLLTLVIYFLGVWKSILRLKAVEIVLTDYKIIISKHRLMHYLSSPLIALIFLYNLIASIKTNQITWRGVVYDLKAPKY